MVSPENKSDICNLHVLLKSHSNFGSDMLDSMVHRPRIGIVLCNFW